MIFVLKYDNSVNISWFKGFISNALLYQLLGTQMSYILWIWIIFMMIGLNNVLVANIFHP